MTPQSLRQIVREFEIRARLEARLHYKMNRKRIWPPSELTEIHRARYMRAYREAYSNFEKTDQRD
jgi:hypothetical protein